MDLAEDDTIKTMHWSNDERVMIEASSACLSAVQSTYAFRFVLLFDFKSNVFKNFEKIWSFCCDRIMYTVCTPRCGKSKVYASKSYKLQYIQSVMGSQK